MAMMLRYSPISDLLALHNAMDRLFSETLSGGGRGRTELSAVGEGYLPLDIYQTDKEWVVRAAVPGVDPQDVEVTCDRNTITISGEIRWPEGKKSEEFWFRENYYGKFRRQITLPEETLCDQSKAEFRDGLLVLTVPRAQPSKPQAKKIPIVAGSAGSSQRQVTSGERQAASASAQRQTEGATRK